MATPNHKDVIIIGASIGGLAFALALHRAGIGCRIIEAAAEVKALGVGLNLLPHAMRDLFGLGVGKQIEAKGIQTREICFYKRHGQRIHADPRGRYAGYEWPQVSIHRGDLHAVLLDAVRERLGPDAVALGHKCIGVEQDSDAAIVRVADPATGAELPALRGGVAIACDGNHSVARALMHPAEAVPRYEGTTQYRGTTRWKPFLSGASMCYVGTYETGKLIIYPIRDNIDAEAGSSSTG